MIGVLASLVETRLGDYQKQDSSTGLYNEAKIKLNSQCQTRESERVGLDIVRE